MAKVEFYNKDFNKPFFAYGAFKPNQVAFSVIEGYVDSFKIYNLVNYELLHRNGMPMISRENGYNTEGYLIYFNKDNAREAYNAISQSKSISLYEWKELKIESESFNCLISRKKEYGKTYGDSNYDGRKDIGFCQSLYYIKENLEEFESKKYPESNDFLFLQMNYMLLWGIIDKYTSLRYGGWGQGKKVEILSQDPLFRKGLRKYANGPKDVFSSRSSDKCILDMNNRNKKRYSDAAKYYYHVRCNITHGGKVSWGNHYQLANDLGELLSIMEYVLKESFTKFSIEELERGYPLNE